ncbi:MAG TPA: hypothetical protein VGM44_20465, partial [Polyangiaceae bacterium]
MKTATRPALRNACMIVALALGVVLTPSTAPALEVPVLLGDVGVGREVPDVRAELRSLLREELASADF